MSVTAGAVLVGVISLTMMRSANGLMEGLPWCRAIDSKQAQWIAAFVGIGTALMFGFDRTVWQWACLPEPPALYTLLYFLAAASFFSVDTRTRPPSAPLRHRGVSFAHRGNCRNECVAGNGCHGHAVPRGRLCDRDRVGERRIGKKIAAKSKPKSSSTRPVAGRAHQACWGPRFALLVTPQTSAAELPFTPAAGKSFLTRLSAKADFDHFGVG